MDDRSERRKKKLMAEQPLLPPADFRIQYARQMQQALMDVGFWKCCLNCENWSNHSPQYKGFDPVNLCRKYNAMPPLDVLVLGCESWLCVLPF